MGEVLQNRHTEAVPTFSERRREQREREFKNELSKLGCHTRELVLYKIEAMQTDLHYWHEMAAHRGRCAMNYAALCIKHAQTIVAQQKEIERLRALLG